jgi:ABC-type histidine transport system ATPase subunit
MAKVEHRQETTRKRAVELVVSGVSLVTAFAVFNFAWNFRSDVEKVVTSQIHVLKPSNDVIRSVCSELIEKERSAKERDHQELREAINWIMRNLNKDRPR